MSFSSLIDFLSENTDTIFAHPFESLEPLHFKYDGQVPYPDFDKPFRLELKSGPTRIVSAGCRSESVTGRISRAGFLTRWPRSCAARNGRS